MQTIDQPDQPEGLPTYTLAPASAELQQAIKNALATELTLTGKSLDDLTYLSLNVDVNNHGTMQIILSK